MGIIQLIIALPGLIITIIKIVNKIKEFQGSNFWSVVKLIGEIISLILGLVPTEKVKARKALKRLSFEIKKMPVSRDMTGLNGLKAELHDACTDIGCPSDLIERGS